jgi:hypothetical protein
MEIFLPMYSKMENATCGLMHQQYIMKWMRIAGELDWAMLYFNYWHGLCDSLVTEGKLRVRS